ncbi:nickel pincer cofactor biosynthesis protein LarB [uncultured Adlercreutzia sp.]|uniref:nickel pincer cofactor biosynthesis protein LarB n=1 Tax=uncultured Adlercreutzia sp. TaxID=875803 RepID=UPI0026759B41|nr:nickel pincer cofactor biosynthesis protein LarB [uncultured Adlercreutzia sp.]
MDIDCSGSVLDFARPDLDRAARQGAGEVIFGEGKTAAQIAAIAAALIGGGQERVLATRVSAEKARAVAAAWEEREAARRVAGSSSLAAALAARPVPLVFHEEARLLVFGGMPAPDGDGRVVVAAAGTSDLPVAEEAALTAEFLGNEVDRLYDVGVAGIHRLLDCADTLGAARAVVAVAGMEGALASVVGGLVSCPVIAVPTSVGYGASFGGIAALLAMLNSCASGVSVVNIDNGFGAAFQASAINHLNSRQARA